MTEPPSDTPTKTAPREDGSLYARDEMLLIRPKRSDTGISMGGVIAHCQNEETAQELARAVNSHPRLVAALQRLDAFFDFGETLSEKEACVVAYSPELQTAFEEAHEALSTLKP